MNPVGFTVPAFCQWTMQGFREPSGEHGGISDAVQLAVGQMLSQRTQIG